MADEGQGVLVEHESPAPEVVVTVEPEDRVAKPLLSDDEVEKLSEAPPDGEIERYAKDAQKRIKAMHTANLEWKKRAQRAHNDLAAATNLATQLYQENQQLRVSTTRSETALVEQAIQRSDAQLQQARVAFRQARAAGDVDAEAKAQEDIARCVSEGERLRLLKPAGPGGDAEPAGVAPPAAQPQPPARPKTTPATQAWIDRNGWFNEDQEMRDHALGVHHMLAVKGITEISDPQAYFGTIDKAMRKAYPDKFKAAAEPAGEPHPAPAGARPVAVVGAPRAAAGVNGGSNGKGPRQVTLSESQLRIAKGLDLTPEQYAMQLVKEGKAS